MFNLVNMVSNLFQTVKENEIMKCKTCVECLNKPFWWDFFQSQMQKLLNNNNNKKIQECFF